MLRTRRQLPDLTPFGLFLAEHGISNGDAADALDLTRSYIHMLANGRATPQLKISIRILKWTKKLDPKNPVTPESWEPFILDYKARHRARA